MGYRYDGLYKVANVSLFVLSVLVIDCSDFSVGQLQDPTERIFVAVD